MALTAQLRLIHREESMSGKTCNESARRRTRVAAVLLGLFIALLWLWSYGAQQRAIDHMPQEQRHALFERTLENLRSVCTGSADGMRDWCQSQANLALELRECDRDCQDLARRQLSRLQLPR
jgi:hypothetical protein